MPEIQANGTWRPFYICPKCGYPQYCGCATCIKYIPEGIKPNKHTSHGTQCAGCGFTPEIGWWMDYEWDLAVLSGAQAFYGKWYSCCDGVINMGYESATYYSEDWDGGEIQYI